MYDEREPPASEVATLLEREGELARIDEALARAGGGGAILIEGPAGIGKTSLLDRLGRRAEGAGHLVLRAQGSEIERDFGFGIVRQLFGRLLRGLDAPGLAQAFAGPAALAAAIFGMAEDGQIEVGAAEASLFGLFWLVAGLAEGGPMVLAIDDAHWCDTASLRFVQYLSRRLDGIPLLIALAARPNEPGPGADALRGMAVELDIPTIEPSLLSGEATAEIVRARFDEAAPAAVASAFHEATGGNPFLVEELVAELKPDSGEDWVAPESIARIGPRRIETGVIDRARAVDPDAPEVLRAIAVLGAGTDLRVVAALAAVEGERVAAIVDGLAAISLLAPGSDHRFAHPLFRTAVYEQIPTAARGEAHARAAELLVAHGAEPEAIAAHILLCKPGSTTGAFAILDLVATRAADRGAADSAVAYLRRSLEELAADAEPRGELLHRLGRAEVSLRDPSSIGHLGEAIELTDDPGRALDISLELIEVLSIAGQWEAAIATIEATLARFGATGLPALLDLEAVRAAARGFDPARVADYEADLPRLLALVEGRTDPGSSQLRWVLGGIGAIQGLPRATVLELIGPTSQDWGFGREDRESSLVANGAFGLLLVDALAEAELVAAAMSDEGRRRGSLLAAISGVGLRASIEERQGRLQESEASLAAAIELLGDNELSLMALTSVLHFCLGTIVERRGLETLAGTVDDLELPPPFAQTFSGALVLEVRAAVRMMRGDREGAVVALRQAASLFGPMRTGPRTSRWRSRLALALPDADREEALALVAEELALAEQLDSPRAVGVALRARGMLAGGEAGIEDLRRSVTTLEASPSPLEVAHSLTELGAALRRGNRRGEARDRLRVAADLAQRCGAERLEQRIDEEMGVAGAKPRRRAISGPESLTPAEHRVAAAAAAGATNREIGQSLFVSLRTVETHLTSSYRKLGISSREELEAALAPSS